MNTLPLGGMISIWRSRSHECSMFTQMLSSWDGSASVAPAGNPMKFSVGVYDAWPSSETQFGAADVHCASVEHVSPDDTPSGSGIGVACGFSTEPHTGQSPMPEQSTSEQSVRPSWSLSTPSLQTSAPNVD